MHVIPVTYTDFNGVERKEEHRFNLTKAEVTEWLMSPGTYTLDVLLRRIMETGNKKELMDFAKDLICRTYGVISPDGRGFIKNEEILNTFMATEAYSMIFMDLISDAKKAAEFVSGVLPKDLSDEIDKVIKENPEGIPDELKDYLLTSKE